MLGRPAVSFVNAMVVATNGRLYDSVRVKRGRIDRLGAGAARDDVVVDLGGDVVLPGLINAHDHLELNSLERLKWRAHYVNAREWIDDFQPRFRTDARLARATPATLADRLWAGGLKNLLSGATTVCHHNPMHRALGHRFPVRVVRKFGLSHSLGVDGFAVAAACRATPFRWPWIIHAAEGTDAAAGAEIDTLDRLGCLEGNTVLVHGVGMRPEQARRVLARGGALVWCPTSNEFLFRTTADVRPFARAGQLALGTDSRLSGEGDLLDELRAAQDSGQVSPEALFRAVTMSAASILRLADGGILTDGARADLVVLRRLTEDPFECLVSARRTDVRLVMVDGSPLVGDRGTQPVFACAGQPVRVVAVDGIERLLARWIADRAATLVYKEPGLEVGGQGL